MGYTENMTFEEASHALMKDLKTRLAELHGHFDAQNVDWHKLHLPLAKLVSEETQKSIGSPEVVEVRPKELECDVVRYQNNKEKWVALVGLLNGHPYEIFTGLQDEDEGIMLPKSVTKGKIIKTVLPEGQKRYDFQFVNKRGYKITVEGLSEKFNPEYGTMPSSYPAFCAIVCRLPTSSSWSISFSSPPKPSIPGGWAWKEP